MLEITCSVALVALVSYVILRDMSCRYTQRQIVGTTIKLLVVVYIALTIPPTWLRVTIIANMLILLWVVLYAP
ncbi:MAG: hypothetical protein EA396_09235 [Anaerolineaceae bacterium]|nr:MAG: hypothetical protein EA396_09235 [Anaerolineaceae bacterium]